MFTSGGWIAASATEMDRCRQARGLVVPRDKRACIHIHMDGKKTQVSREIQRDTFNDCWMYLA